MFSKKILGKNTSSLSSMDNALSTQTTSTSENPFVQYHHLGKHIFSSPGTRCVPSTTAARDQNTVAVKQGWWDVFILGFHLNISQAGKLGVLGRGGGRNEIFYNEVHWGSGE